MADAGVPSQMTAFHGKLARRKTEPHRVSSVLRGELLWGFTLTELMIVVAILGLLLVIAIPNFVRARENSMNSRYAADMRVAADSFIMYAQEKGNYPRDVWPGILPQGMGEYLKRMDWLGRTPLGGLWDWDNWPRVKGVSALETTASREQLLRVDRLLDDGNLSTGAFRDRGGGSTYIYILEGSL